MLLIVVRNFAIAHFFSGVSLSFLGMVAGLSPWVVFGVPFISYSVAFFLSRRFFRLFTLNAIKQSLRDFPKLPLGVILLFLFLNTLFSLLPPSEHIEIDALGYHLAIPWQYYLRGGVVPIDWSVPDKFPLYLQMAQLPFTVLMFPWVVKVFNLLVLPFLLIIVWNFCSLFAFSKIEKAFIIAFISSLSLLIKQYGTAMFDLTNAFYVLLAFLTLLRRELFLGTLLLGMVCALKTFFLYFAFVWGASFFIWNAFFLRNFTKRDLVFMSLPLVWGLVFISPVWIRNYLTTGNPVFPLFLDVFGPYIEPYRVRMLQSFAAHYWGYGHSFFDMLLAPFRFVLPFPRKFDYWTDPILLLFLFAAIVGVRQSWKEVRGLVYLIAIFLYISFFFLSQEARYLYPFWIVVVVLGGTWVFKKIPRKILTGLLCFQALLGSTSFFFFHRDALAAIRHIKEHDYLAHNSGSYVWNETLKSHHFKELCIKSSGDILYFTFPIRLLDHHNSILSIKPSSLEGCDAFVIGAVTRFDPYLPENKPRLVAPRLVTPEEFLK